MAYPERRRFQRLRLGEPVKGRLSGMRVAILDVSTTGARVEHSFPLAAGRRLTLEFPWQEESISLQCDVVRCAAHRGGSIATANAYASGLKFCEPPGPARASLVRMITELVSRDMARLRDSL
jgi:hypothetical protein